MNALQSVLEIPILSRIRRNHALEHATLSVLAARKPGIRLAGHSGPSGFWILGEVGTEELTEVTLEALRRLRAGEAHLAVHANCGTNFVTSGIFAGLAGALAMTGAGRRTRDKLERLPVAALFATLALILSRPFAFAVQQRITTAPHPGGLRVVQVMRSRRGGMIAHRITTQG